jgi:hypothetical protein
MDLIRLQQQILKAFGVQDRTMEQAATRGFANSRAVDFRLLLNKAMKEALELAKELNKLDGTIGGDVDGEKRRLHLLS